MEIRKRNKKGILLTLVTIVLFLLMLAELITYITINVNYDIFAATSASSFAGYSVVTTINKGLVAYLHSDLNNALSALIRYESTPTQRSWHFVNNTPLVLQSLMSNGIIYGTNVVGNYMSNSVLNIYIANLQRQAASEGVNLSISNSMLTVFQSGPSSINATYTALATVNSPQGSFSYPIVASSGIGLNGTKDLLLAQGGGSSILRVLQAPPSATFIGNSIATAGSRSSFMFAYGTVILESGNPGCSGIPTQFQSNSYILALANSMNIAQNACGMGGLITVTPNSATPLVPYLVYPSSSNVFNAINNGTSLLLNGPGLELLSVSSVQSAIQSGYYLQSAYAPSYFDYAQGSLWQRSPNGLLSLGSIASRQIDRFDGSTSWIKLGNNNAFGFPQGGFTISAWIKTSSSAGDNEVVAKGGSCNVGGYKLITNLGYLRGTFDNQAGNPFYQVWSRSLVNDSRWHHVVFTVSGLKTTSTIGTLYIDGNLNAVGPATDTHTWNILTPDDLGIGSSDKNDPITCPFFFLGNIADVQLYSVAIMPQQVSQLYRNGINGAPLVNGSIVGWWPLNGDPNDYSGNNLNGTSTGINYASLVNYAGDPAYQGSFYSNATNKVEGVSNCANINQCSNFTLQQFYLSNPLTQQQLGLSTAIIPNVASLVYTANAYININNIPVNVAAGGLNTVSFWMKWGGIYGEMPVGFLSYDLYTTSGCFGFNTGNGDDIGFSPAGLVNRWVHVAAEFYNGVPTPSGTVSIYINGVQQTLSQCVGTSLSRTLGSNMHVSGWPNGAGYYFNNSIADLQVYNIGLTQMQVQQLYLNNSVNGLNAVGYWPLSGGYNNLMNQTPDLINGNTGFWYANTILCTNANAVSNICGYSYAAP